MQDKDLFNGVTGKYTDRIDENGVVKRNGVDAENAMKTDILRPPGFGVRHLQIILLFSGLFMSYALRVNISVGIVAMVDQSGGNVTYTTYNWDKQQQGLILSSFFWGYLVAQIPISQLAKRFGGKLLLTIASIFCAVLTILTPWMASIDWKLMLVSRALQGLFQGAYYPCVHTLLSKWVHPMERGTLTTITYSGTQAGSVVMLAVSGLFASSTMGWPSIFYFSGCGTLIWTVFWMIFGSSSPAECTRISIDEKKFIESMPGSSHCQLKTPWSSILRSKPVIALIIVHATQCWGFWSLLTETPSYLVQIFQFNIKTNALLSALPYLAMWIVSLVVCPISDYLINGGYIGIATGRKLFNSLGHWMPALTLIILPFLKDPTHAIIMLTIAIGMNGFSYCGYICNHMDLSPNFAGGLMGLTNTLANIMSILGPLTIGYILTEDDDIDTKMSEWKIIFFIAAAFFFLGNLIFVIFGKASIQPWNDPEEQQKLPQQQQVQIFSVEPDDERLGSHINIIRINSSS